MRITRALVPLAMAGALLAGCGGDGDGDGGTPGPTDNGVSALTPNEIVDRAKAALEGAKSYRISGDIDADGQKMALDFKISGSDLIGSITSEGAKVEMLSVGGQNYIRPDAAFWTMTAGAEGGETMAKLMGDKWAQLSADDDEFNDLFTITDPDELLKPEGTVTKGETKDVAGTKAIGLVDGGTDGGALYVATVGEPYPLQMVGPKNEGQISFSDFGATFSEIATPPESEVIDLDKLKSGS
jgi:hypothetical protein